MATKKRSPELKRMQESIKDLGKQIYECIKDEDMKTARSRIGELKSRVSEIERMVRMERKHREE